METISVSSITSLTIETHFLISVWGSPKGLFYRPHRAVQCLNIVAKIYLCFNFWLRTCQLFTVLIGVILKSFKKLGKKAGHELNW